ncbi:MAG: M48 family metallopeptidase [Gammaproteobacteria bacterium]|nr:M48 family metalloprotease [Pseudomonadales bacterium]MCP5348768.1 M48 family metalloprotease [Pseudomonadales bacterium]
MGRQSDPAATAQFGGLYPDQELQDYITGLGMSLVAVSERPNLPWSFKLVDHELINAFALPGGFIYITRGILANMNSEAELVGVLGHEVGHVTARHAARQITQQQIGMIGLIGGSIISETVRNNTESILQAMQLLSLRYSRQDEAQADELGYRYLVRTEHNPEGLTAVMRMLQSTSPSAEEMGVPGWMLSHPDPGDRVAANERRIARAQQDFSDFLSGRDQLLSHLDGLVFGEDPRQGYFIGQRFIQPQLALELTFPQNWTTQNSPQSVQAAAPDRDAVMQLSIAETNSPQAALSGFMEQGVTINQNSSQTLNGLDVAWADFSASPPEGQSGQPVRGYVLYAASGDTVYQVLGYTLAERWETAGPVLAQSIMSFQPLRDDRYRDVAPHRIDLVRLPESMTAADFLRRYPSSVDNEAVLLANQVSENERLERGRLMKRITGGRVPER